MELIEVITHLAQQLVDGKKPDERCAAYLTHIFHSGGGETRLIKAAIKSLDAPQLERYLRRGTSSDTTTKPDSIPGKRIILYKAPLPVEVQSRVAADSLIARYLSWLARNPRRRAVVLEESDHHVVLFDPGDSGFDPKQAWEEFSSFIFSGEELTRTFIAMLNSIQLSDRGFGVPEFPIVSDDQKLVVLAWLLRSVRIVEKRLRWREMKIVSLKEIHQGLNGREKERAGKEIEKLCEKQDRELEKYRKHFTRRLRDLEGVDEKLTNEEINDPFEFLNQFENQHPQVFSKVHRLAELFTERSGRQINLTRGDNLASAIVEIAGLVSQIKATNLNDTGSVHSKKFKVRPLLFEEPRMLVKRSPGDGTGEFCYVCGELLTVEDKAQVNRFVFRSPSQRLQSVRGEKRPPVCNHCVAIASVSPLKPSDQSVVVKLDSPFHSKRQQGRSAATLGELESFLRGLTLSQLDLAAGDYLMLTSERIKVGNKWKYYSDVIGTVVFAYLRLADLFEYQIFFDHQARIVAGISDIQLEAHRLAFLSILIKSLQLRLVESGGVNRPLASAARYVMADEPFLAIYELVSQPNINSKLRQEMVCIEIEKSLEAWTKMTSDKNRAKVITDVVAMAGLLYPFIDQTMRKVREKNDSKLDPDREAAKLIEEVDEVFNFIYRFADNTTYSTARLYSNPTNWFTFEQTKKLLGGLGIDVSEREKTEDRSRFIEVNANDVEAAYRKFAEGDYKADTDWRAFTYRLKLALYSRFPGLGVKKEKSQ